MSNHNASRAGQPLPEFDPYARHKATYLDESKPVAERDASGRWLLDNGFIGLDGKFIVLGSGGMR